MTTNDDGQLPVPKLVEVLDAIGVAVVLLRAEGGLVFANLAGRRLLVPGGHLVHRDGRVHAAAAAQVQPFDRAMAKARAGQCGVLKLGEGAGRRMLAILPLPVPLTQAPLPYVLLLTGRESPTEATSLLLFARSLGLTGCERDVLDGLCKGLRAGEIARQRAVKITTVRTQIGNLRSKMGVRDISELVMRMSTLPPLVNRLSA